MHIAYLKMHTYTLCILCNVSMCIYVAVCMCGCISLYYFGNRSKAPDKKLPGRKPPDNKPPRIIKDTIAKYAVDANLLWLKIKSSPWFHFGALIPRDFCPGGFCPGDFYRGAFDLEPFF